MFCFPRQHAGNFYSVVAQSLHCLKGTLEVGGSHYIPGPFNKVITPRILELSLRSSYGSKIITINSIMITSSQ